MSYVFFAFKCVFLMLVRFLRFLWSVPNVPQRYFFGYLNTSNSKLFAVVRFPFHSTYNPC